MIDILARKSLEKIFTIFWLTIFVLYCKEDECSGTDLQLSGDLLLQGLDVLDELLTRRLEQKVPVGKPGRVAETHQLEHLGKEGESVDCVHHSARQPDGGESTDGVDYKGGLVLNVLPLQYL